MAAPWGSSEVIVNFTRYALSFRGECRTDGGQPGGEATRLGPWMQER